MICWCTEAVLLLITAVIIAYTYWNRQIKEISKRGLRFVKPIPFTGNNLPVVLKKKHFTLLVDDVYKKFSDEKYVGYFNFNKLNVMLRDTDLITQVTLKHFDHFVDHYTFLDEEQDPLFFYGLFHLNGDRWKDMRASLTPAFTGSKMKEMLPFIKICAKSLVDHINKSIDEGNGTHVDEMKSLMMKSSNDTIASCAFGVICDSYKEPDNQFFKMATVLTQGTPQGFIRILPIIMFPKLSKFFGLTLMKDELNKYYRHIVKDIMKHREDTGAVRRDMIHLLMLAKQGKLQNEKNTADTQECLDLTSFFDNLVEKRGMKRNWKDDEIIAQALIFLFAGYDTTSTLLSFLLYELTLSQHCQKKLQEEVDEHIAVNGEDIDYVHINKLKYLDMVVSETLRLWPPVGQIDRLCTKDFNLPPTGNNTKGFTVLKDEIVMIPMYSIHRDPQYWKDPLKFDPERFSDENKSSINPSTYLPFGLGPRSCIGNRFALMEVKMILFYLMANFNLSATPKTEIPLTFRSHFVFMNAKNGIWIQFSRRHEK